MSVTWASNIDLPVQMQRRTLARSCPRAWRNLAGFWQKLLHFFLDDMFAYACHNLHLAPEAWKCRDCTQIIHHVDPCLGRKHPSQPTSARYLDPENHGRWRRVLFPWTGEGGAWFRVSATAHMLRCRGLHFRYNRHIPVFRDSFRQESSNIVLLAAVEDVGSLKLAAQVQDRPI